MDKSIQQDQLGQVNNDIPLKNKRVMLVEDEADSNDIYNGIGIRC